MTKREEIPSYYIGKKHKIEARKVVEDFQGDNYNLGTAITYVLLGSVIEFVGMKAFLSFMLTVILYSLYKLNQRSVNKGETNVQEWITEFRKEKIQKTMDKKQKQSIK